MRGIAPQATILDYEGPKTGAGIAALIARIVADGRADIVSVSWGGCERMMPASAVALVELAGVYDAIATELANQYSLGYQSTNQARNGNFRRIALKILKPGLTWRTRAGYIADRASRPAAVSASRRTSGGWVLDGSTSGGSMS